MFSVCFEVLEQSCGMRAKRKPRAKDMTWPFPHIMRGSLSTNQAARSSSPSMFFSLENKDLGSRALTHLDLIC